MKIVIIDADVLIAGVITANTRSPTVRIVDGILRGVNLPTISRLDP